MSKKLNISFGDIQKMDTSDKELLKRTRTSHAEYKAIGNAFAVTKVKGAKLAIEADFVVEEDGKIPAQLRNLATSVNAYLREIGSSKHVLPRMAKDNDGKYTFYLLEQVESETEE